MSWWDSFFDANYVRIWSGFIPPEQSRREADGIWELLGLHEGSRVLDAPCGYGRLARLLAQRGAVVLGVDQSFALLEQAETDRKDVPGERLRYMRHDLRVPLSEEGFDVAINVFTSLGYGTEEDDLAILETLRRAVRPGGLVFVETAHRDATVAFLSRSEKHALRLQDGTLVIEEPTFDPVLGRVQTCWYWRGPAGAGQKPASLRIYTITELARLIERAGLRLRSAHHGCSTEPYEAKGPEMGGRVGLLAVRP